MHLTVGQQLQRARFKKGLSLRKLSGLTGVSVNAIVDAERGARRSNGQTLARLAPVLELDLDQLLDAAEAEAVAS